MLDEVVSYAATQLVQKYDIVFSRSDPDGPMAIEHIFTDDPSEWIMRMRNDPTVTQFALLDGKHNELMHCNKVKSLPNLYQFSDIALAQIIGLENLYGPTKLVARRVAAWAASIELRPHTRNRGYDLERAWASQERHNI